MNDKKLNDIKLALIRKRKLEYQAAKRLTKKTKPDKVD